MHAYTVAAADMKALWSEGGTTSRGEGCKRSKSAKAESLGGLT